LNYSLAEKILESISPLTLLAFEMIVGTILFCTALFLFGYRADLIILKAQPKVLWLTICDIFVVLIASLLIFYSIQAKNATVAAIIELIYPLFTIFFTWMLFQQSHITWHVIVGGGLILIGVFIIGFA